MVDALLIIFPVLTIVVFVWIFGWLRRRKPKKVKVDDHTRQERAIWAWAKILSSNQAPVSSYHVARVDLQLEVHMPGNPAYQVKTTWLVDENSLSFVQQGQEISLKVDPEGPEHVYPNGSWAQLLTK